MKRVAHSFFVLPGLNGKVHRSSWRMTNEEAAQRGAISIVPGSTEWREVPETPEEVARAQVHYPTAGRDSVQPPK